MVSFLKWVNKSNACPAFSFIRRFVDDLLVPAYPDLSNFMYLDKDFIVAWAQLYSSDFLAVSWI
jgi:hypothetical protein